MSVSIFIDMVEQPLTMLGEKYSKGHAPECLLWYFMGVDSSATVNKAYLEPLATETHAAS